MEPSDELKPEGTVEESASVEGPVIPESVDETIVEPVKTGPEETISAPAEAEVEEVASEAVEPEGEAVKVEPAVPAEPVSPARKSFWSKILPWVIVAVVFFLGGLATLYFTLYQKAVSTADQNISALTEQLDQTKADLKAEEDKISLIQDELDKTRTTLNTVQADLTAAQATIEEQDAALASSNQKKVAYKFLLDVNAARAALEKQDAATTRQAISFAKTDLAELQATGIAAESLSGFSDRLAEAEANLGEANLTKSRNALDTLYSNLLLLVNNLE